jgi:TolB-like protein
MIATLVGVVSMLSAGQGRAQEPAPAETPDAAPVEKPPEKASVIVLDLKPTNADPETARLITDLVAVSLGRTRAFQVLTSEDVRSVVALEAEKHAMGCDDASCLAEIAGAMGADFVVHGSVGALGELFVVNLNLFDSQMAKSVGRESAQVRDRAELPGAIDAMMKTMVRDLVPEEAAAEPPPPAPAAEPTPAPVAEGSGENPPFLSPLFLGGAAGAVLCAGGAVGLAVVAVLANGTVEDKTAPGDERASARTLGQGAVVGAAALGVGAAIAAGVAVVPFVLE